MGSAVAMREVAAGWYLSTRRPTVEEERTFLRSARRAVRDWSAYLGAAPADIDDAVLGVSELVTNAIRHGHAPYELHLRETWSGLRWSVIDAGPGKPAISSALARARTGHSPLAEYGRGLALVAGLYADVCEVRTTVSAQGQPATEVAFVVPWPGRTPAV